jgi:hypothetical protein
MTEWYRAYQNINTETESVRKPKINIIKNKTTWFTFCDKWHRESFVHCVIDAETRSICGRQDITPVNSDSMLEFKTIENIPFKDLCKSCLRKTL